MSNLFKRVSAGVIGIPLLIFIFYSGGIVFLIFSVLVTSLALMELYSMLELKNFHTLKIPAVVLSGLMSVYMYFKEIDFIVPLFIIFILMVFFELIRKENRNPLNPFISTGGIVYITIPFIMLGKINEYSEINLIIYIFVMIWTCDTTAYFGGKLFGKHPLSSVSPNKTIEGSVTGFLFTVGVSILIHYLFPDKLGLKDAVAAGVITGIFSQAGDLFESLLKRYCGVKDSSEIIPGHGGILDRFDSVIFAAPLLYIYFMYFS